MFIKTKRGWELPESAATPESVYLGRRHFLAAAGMTVAAPLALAGPAQADDTADPSAGLYPVKRNETYKLDREITPEALSFYDIDMKWTVEAGEFAVFVGTSSRDCDLHKTILEVR